MQLCECEIRLGGNANNTNIRVSRKSPEGDGLDLGLVTPAEIVILKAIHGEDAVVNIKPVKMDKRAHEIEWSRLEMLYGRSPEGLMDAGNGQLLDKLFPGAIKRLPVHLKDIGLGHLMNPNGKALETVEAQPEDDGAEDE